MADFSDYIVYVDESGDQGLVSIDAHYPVFVLALCIFEEQAYRQQGQVGPEVLPPEQQKAPVLPPRPTVDRESPVL